MKTLFNIEILKQIGVQKLEFTDAELEEIKKTYQGKYLNKHSIHIFSDTREEVVSIAENCIANINHNEWFGLLYKTKYNDSGIGDGNCYNIAIARNVEKETVISILRGKEPSHEIF
jgi:hypothetical protein